MRHDTTQIERSRELRRNPTVAEQRLWRALRNRRFADFKFCRQHPIGPFIVDFYCAAAMLVVELDGESHAGKEESDQRRQESLEGLGYKVLRFWNVDVRESFDDVLECIYLACRERSGVGRAHPSPPAPLPGGRGETVDSRVDHPKRE